MTDRQLFIIGILAGVAIWLTFQFWLVGLWIVGFLVLLYLIARHRRLALAAIIGAIIGLSH